MYHIHVYPCHTPLVRPGWFYMCYIFLFQKKESSSLKKHFIWKIWRLLSNSSSSLHHRPLNCTWNKWIMLSVKQKPHIITISYIKSCLNQQVTVWVSDAVTSCFVTIWFKVNNSIGTREESLFDLFQNTSWHLPLLIKQPARNLWYPSLKDTFMTPAGVCILGTLLPSLHTQLLKHKL